MMKKVLQPDQFLIHLEAKSKFSYYIQYKQIAVIDLQLWVRSRVF